MGSERQQIYYVPYGKGGAIDIRIMENDTDLKHDINITVDDDGKLKAIVSEQTKQYGHR